MSNEYSSLQKRVKTIYYLEKQRDNLKIQLNSLDKEIMESKQLLLDEIKNNQLTDSKMQYKNKVFYYKQQKKYNPMTQCYIKQQLCNYLQSDKALEIFEKLLANRELKIKEYVESCESCESVNKK